MLLWNSRIVSCDFCLFEVDFSWKFICKTAAGLGARTVFGLNRDSIHFVSGKTRPFQKEPKTWKNTKRSSLRVEFQTCWFLGPFTSARETRFSTSTHTRDARTAHAAEATPRVFVDRNVSRQWRDSLKTWWSLLFIVWWPHKASSFKFLPVQIEFQTRAENRHQLPNLPHRLEERIASHSETVACKRKLVRGCKMTVFDAHWDVWH